jgi:hypothetical protein
MPVNKSKNKIFRVRNILAFVAMTILVCLTLAEVGKFVQVWASVGEFQENNYGTTTYYFDGFDRFSVTKFRLIKDDRFGFVVGGDASDQIVTNSLFVYPGDKKFSNAFAATVYIFFECRWSMLKGCIPK